MTFENYSDVLSFRVLLRILIVFYISALRCIDSVISTHCTVVAWEPVCSALAEYNVARNHILICYRTVSLLLAAAYVISNIPPDFLAPRRFPGPSFALLTAPCWACDACRTNVKTGLEAIMESWPNASLRQTFELPTEADRPIDVSAARIGCCDRGSSITSAGDGRAGRGVEIFHPSSTLSHHNISPASGHLT